MFSNDPYTGQVALTIAPGLPTGTYDFFALSSVSPAALGTGLTDAAGNPFAGYANSAPMNYQFRFNLQPTPTYITNYQAFTPDASTAGGYDVTGATGQLRDPRAREHAPVNGPPNIFFVDFSNALNPNVNYTNDVQLVRSADSLNGQPDGNFGDLGITNTGTGYTVIPGTTVTLVNSESNCRLRSVRLRQPAGDPAPGRIQPAG